MMKYGIIVLFLLSCSQPQKVLEPILKPEPLPIGYQDYVNKFIVQNVASLTIRGYGQACEICPRVLMFQSPMVVGKDEETKRSILGSFEIDRWEKFHVDYEGQYQKWITPPLPGLNSIRSDWGKRGAFGWYTAILTPGAHGQWLHGTIGFASDQDRFILPEENGGVVLRVKSKGCTRVSNLTISFIKEFFPKGTPVYKIYALESQEIPAKESSYAFTNKLDHKGIIYEEFSGLINQTPKAIRIKEVGESLQDKTNPYEVKLKHFRGLFIVDQGVLVDYKTPRPLKTNGKEPRF